MRLFVLLCFVYASNARIKKDIVDERNDLYIFFLSAFYYINMIGAFIKIQVKNYFSKWYWLQSDSTKYKHDNEDNSTKYYTLMKNKQSENIIT